MLIEGIRLTRLHNINKRPCYLKLALNCESLAVSKSIVFFNNKVKCLQLLRGKQVKMSS